MLTAICCTFGRHNLLERTARMFLDQEYEGDVELLIYNNHPQKLKLGFVPAANNKRVRLVNNNIDSETSLPYSDTGAIFRDALMYVLPETQTITFMDDDDIYLPEHLFEGNKGIGVARMRGKLAYKPYKSYFWWDGKITKEHNNMEPSIFVDYEYVKAEGFHPNACSYHQKWLDKLYKENKILEWKEGIPTLIYDWGSNSGAFKMSGRGDDKGNFQAHKQNSLDLGDNIITPWSKEKMDKLWGHINILLNKIKN